jgi:hypothetical protein
VLGVLPEVQRIQILKVAQAIILCFPQPHLLVVVGVAHLVQMVEQMEVLVVVAHET